MAKSIITQEGNLVNYANIVTVTVEISDDGEVYGLIATLLLSYIHKTCINLY